MGGDRRNALKALLTNPLVGDYAWTAPLLDALLEANRSFLPRFFASGSTRIARRLDPSRDARVDPTTKGFPTVDRSVRSRTSRHRDGRSRTSFRRCSCSGAGPRAQHRPDGRLLREPRRRAGAAREDHDGAAALATPARRGGMGDHRRDRRAGAVMLAAGVRRVLIANEVTDPPVDRIDRGPAARPRRSRSSAPWIPARRGAPRGGDATGCLDRFPVLVELGHRAVAPAAGPSRTRSRSLPVTTKPSSPWQARRASRGRSATTARRLPRGGPAFLDRLGALAARLRADGLVETEETWVSAGGSAFFDLVVEHLGDRGRRRPGAPPLRSLRRPRLRGERAGVAVRRHEPERRFHAAIEAWGAVLSRPEPDLAIVDSAGGTFRSTRACPCPSRLRRRSGERTTSSARVIVERLNDQHAFCRVEPRSDRARRPRRVRRVPSLHRVRQVAGDPRARRRRPRDRRGRDLLLTGVGAGTPSASPSVAATAAPHRAPSSKRLRHVRAVQPGLEVAGVERVARADRVDVRDGRRRDLVPATLGIERAGAPAPVLHHDLARTRPRERRASPCRRSLPERRGARDAAEDEITNRGEGDQGDVRSEPHRPRPEVQVEDAHPAGPTEQRADGSARPVRSAA